MGTCSFFRLSGKVFFPHLMMYSKLSFGPLLTEKKNIFFLWFSFEIFKSPVKNNRNTKCGKCHPNVSLEIFICLFKLFFI
jgi:hypothetical protein